MSKKQNINKIAKVALVLTLGVVIAAIGIKLAEAGTKLTPEQLERKKALRSFHSKYQPFPLGTKAPKIHPRVYIDLQFIEKGCYWAMLQTPNGRTSYFIYRKGVTSNAPIVPPLNCNAYIPKKPKKSRKQA